MNAIQDPQWNTATTSKWTSEILSLGIIRTPSLPWKCTSGALQHNWSLWCVEEHFQLYCWIFSSTLGFCFAKPAVSIADKADALDNRTQSPISTLVILMKEIIMRSWRLIVEWSRLWRQNRKMLFLQRSSCGYSAGMYIRYMYNWRLDLLLLLLLLWDMVCHLPLRTSLLSRLQKSAFLRGKMSRIYTESQILHSAAVDSEDGVTFKS